MDRNFPESRIPHLILISTNFLPVVFLYEAVSFQGQRKDSLTVSIFLEIFNFLIDSYISGG